VAKASILALTSLKSRTPASAPTGPTAEVGAAVTE
jgi:hypothetical protein